jgi:hypothetical protein
MLGKFINIFSYFEIFFEKILIIVFSATSVYFLIEFYLSNKIFEIFILIFIVLLVWYILSLRFDLIIMLEKFNNSVLFYNAIVFF